jgi:WD40 repeat protein
MDGTMKVWDLRQLKQPLAVVPQLPTNYTTTRCCFSPDERLLLTGTAAAQAAADGVSEGGQVVFVDTQKWEVVRRVGMPTHVAALHWHHRLNQMFVGIGEGVEGMVGTD